MINILDVWGEGRIVTNQGMVTGFEQAKNLNKSSQKISNGPNKGEDIPNLLPVYDYENPMFPIKDDSVNYITLMGAPITEGTAREIWRVIHKQIGVVLLYDPDENSIYNFERNKGGLERNIFGWLESPFDEPTIRPVRIYQVPREEF